MVSVIVINIENKKAPLQKWGFLDFAESLLDTNLSLWSYSMLIFPLSQQYFFIKINKNRKLLLYSNFL